jgi:hypothetical protein
MPWSAVSKASVSLEPIQGVSDGLGLDFVEGGPITFVEESEQWSKQSKTASSWSKLSDASASWTKQTKSSV